MEACFREVNYCCHPLFHFCAYFHHLHGSNCVRETTMFARKPHHTKHEQEGLKRNALAIRIAALRISDIFKSDLFAALLGIRHVWCVKLLAEKAITSSDYKIYILLLDMSKAFDTVNRNQLFETVEEILLPDELHLLHYINQ